jgi:hypothetical protein
MHKLSTAISCLETTLMELVSKMLNLSIYWWMVMMIL